MGRQTAQIQFSIGKPPRPIRHYYPLLNCFDVCCWWATRACTSFRHAWFLLNQLLRENSWQVAITYNHAIQFVQVYDGICIIYCMNIKSFQEVGGKIDIPLLQIKYCMLEMYHQCFFVVSFTYSFFRRSCNTYASKPRWRMLRSARAWAFWLEPGIGGCPKQGRKTFLLDALTANVGLLGHMAQRCRGYWESRQPGLLQPWAFQYTSLFG